MQYCADHPEEINKLDKVKAQVSEIKGVMMENIEKVRHCSPATESFGVPAAYSCLMIMSLTVFFCSSSGS